MRLAEMSYRTVRAIRGPLLFVDALFAAQIGELVTIVAPDKSRVTGEVLSIDGDCALLQVFGETHGLDLGTTRVIFHDAVKQAPLSAAVLGRVFDGSFLPRDGLPMFIPERFGDVCGAPLNPVARDLPQEMIETGLSVIDGLATLVKGQKLPLFSCSGLPGRELVTTLLRQARLPGEGRFVVVFVALGVSHHEADAYRQALNEMEQPCVAFLNLAGDPVVERLLAPRLGLTVAEDLAYNAGMEVLVIMSDMTNYCDALREVSTSREELPGRRGYPGYMYSDLASLYERAGRLRGRCGSVTLLPVLTMPEDDITHPIPDLTGYITEGQIVLSRELHQQGIFPPVDVLPSLSRLMQHGIGPGRSRADHREVANRLYRSYSRGRELRKLAAVVGREGLLEEDQTLLDFAEQFEKEFLHQRERRDLAATLDAGRELLRRFQQEPPC